MRPPASSPSHSMRHFGWRGDEKAQNGHAQRIHLSALRPRMGIEAAASRSLPALHFSLLGHAPEEWEMSVGQKIVGGALVGVGCSLVGIGVHSSVTGIGLLVLVFGLLIAQDAIS